MTLQRPGYKRQYIAPSLAGGEYAVYFTVKEKSPHPLTAPFRGKGDKGGGN
jgi:hypothetical protein